jgi:hypothetical protein
MANERNRNLILPEQNNKPVNRPRQNNNPIVNMNQALIKNPVVETTNNNVQTVTNNNVPKANNNNIPKTNNTINNSVLKTNNNTNNVPKENNTTNNNVLKANNNTNNVPKANNTTNNMQKANNSNNNVPKANNVQQVNNTEQPKNNIIENFTNTIKNLVTPKKNNNVDTEAENKPGMFNTIKNLIVPEKNNNNNTRQKLNNLINNGEVNNNNNNNNNNNIIEEKSFGQKLEDIFVNDVDPISNIIKLATVLVILLVLFVGYNLALKYPGNLKESMFLLIAGAVVFVMGEIFVPKILGSSLPIQIISVILFAIGTALLVMSLLKGYRYFKEGKVNSPMLLSGSKSGRTSMVIPQNSEDPDSIILYRSDNQEAGIEFTYNFWIIIENYEYKSNEWKHIMHKGNKEGTPNMCPGFYLHPNKNSMRVYINTMENMKEHFDIDNLPIKKWINVTLTIKQKVAELFINGLLKKRHTLSSIPRQNFGELWMNLFGGFDGYISKVQYHRRALKYEEIMELIQDGPAGSACVDTGELPPYLDDDWWLNDS